MNGWVSEWVGGLIGGCVGWWVDIRGYCRVVLLNGMHRILLLLLLLLSYTLSECK